MYMYIYIYVNTYLHIMYMYVYMHSKNFMIYVQESTLGRDWTQIRSYGGHASIGLKVGNSWICHPKKDDQFHEKTWAWKKTLIHNMTI